jgi:hypothetical protein
VAVPVPNVKRFAMVPPWESAVMMRKQTSWTIVEKPRGTSKARAAGRIIARSGDYVTVAM